VSPEVALALVFTFGPAPPAPVAPAVKPHAACANCAACGDACGCFGRGYYCSEAAGCSPSRPLAVDSPAPFGHDGGTGDLPDRPAPAGREWKRYPGGPWKLFPATSAAAEVPAVRPFRDVAAPVWNSSHVCPTCGRAQYRVSGYNADGSHDHTCAVDGTTWRHK
jgi:hypothetical protein